MIINEERRKVQEEALEALEKNDWNGICVLPTGTGKSWIMIECLKRISEELDRKLSVLYLCNSTDLRDKAFKDELNKWEAFEWIEEIDYVCYQTAYKNPLTTSDPTYDVVLADEFDYALTPSYSKTFTENRFDRKILVSATIDESKRPLAEKIADIVYEKELEDVETSGILNKSKYYFVNYKMSEAEAKEYERHNQTISQLINMKHAYYSYSVNMKLKIATYARKQFLNSLQSSRDVCKRLLKDIHETDPAAKVLVFSELTEQADRINKETYHGKTTKSSAESPLTQFNEAETGDLGVVGKVDRGVNLKGVNNIIFESCNSSKTKLTQRLGRGKRLKIDENLAVYFLVPYYDRQIGDKKVLRATKILDWINAAARDLDLSKATVYKFKN